MPKAKPKTQTSRRKLLAAMSVGAAAKLPELWSKPTVASVMLPAHAESTQPACSNEELVIASFGPVGDGIFSLVLVGSAQLPNGAYSANFVYPGGTRAVSLDTVNPGSYAATLNNLPAYFAYTECPGSEQVGVRFYPAANTTNVVCSAYDTLVCATASGP